MTEEDLKLAEAFGALAPSPIRQARMQVRILEGHAARPRSLVLEWWSLLRARPIANGALIAVAAAILFFTTPLGALPGLLRGGDQLAAITAKTDVECAPGSTKSRAARRRPTVSPRPPLSPAHLLCEPPDISRK